MRRIGLLVLLVSAIGGCSAVGIATQPDRPDGGPVCDDVKFGGAELRVLSCAEAVAVAEQSLGLHWPISSAIFDRGPHGERDPGHVACPDLACLATQVATGVVHFRFWFGDPVLVTVTLDADDVPVVTNRESVVAQEREGSRD